MPTVPPSGLDDLASRSDLAGLFADDLDIVMEILGHRLEQGDIQRILAKLQGDDRRLLTAKVADLLRKTSALLEISRRVADSLSLDVLLPRMVKLVSEFLAAERTTIFLYARETGELFSRVAQGDLKQEIRIPKDAGLAGHVFTTGESLRIADAYEDARFNREVDRKTGFRTRSVLCVPIRHRNLGVIGVIQVLNHEGGEFSIADVTLLETIAAQASTGFENARLHEAVERARAQETKLLDITTAISQELKLKPLLRKIMETVATLLEADRSTLFLYDSKTNELWSQVALGAAEIRFPAHMGIAGGVFTSGETVNIPDAYADHRFNPEVDRKTGYRTHNILCMPVRSKQGEVMGVIQALNKNGGPFLPVDEKRLEAFCAQAAIAIENAKLFEEVINIKNYNESILRSMSNGVLTLDAEDVVVTANEAARRILREADTGVCPVGARALDFFGSHNGWVADALARVRASGEADVAMDATLVLPHTATADSSGATASVNMTTTPLKDAKGSSLGCMMVMEDLTREKRLRGTMARYMAKEVADKLLEEGESALGGTIQMATVLFSDIRDFTTISERLGAQETVRMLNDYFSIMVDIILNNHGILDKYIGDAIMAVFGAPFPGPNDADNGVTAAIEMLRALAPFNEERLATGQEPVYIGVGLNTDEVLSGNIGSDRRMDYTVIGDGVNLASRLEGANKPYGTQILISEFTRRALQGEYLSREVDLVRVKGKTEPVAVFEVMDHLTDAIFPNLSEVVGHYAEGRAAYREWDWNRAMDRFGRALAASPGDSVSKLYVDRCRYFQEHPPDSGWDGVWEMKTK